MTSLVSAISGHFNRALLFGTLLPVVAFLFVTATVIWPWMPIVPRPVAQLQTPGAEWQAGAALALVVLMTGLLRCADVPLIRLYEGYPWKDSRLGRWRTSRHERARRQLEVRWRGMRTLRYALEAPSGPAAAIPAEEQALLRNEHSRIGRDLNRLYPPTGFLLPTRLGNIIRCFESYPQRQYDMLAISLWPRLVAVIEKDYAAAIDDQRTSFDFMLNSSALAAAAAALLLALGLVYPVPFARPAWFALWIGEISALLALAYVCYVSSLGRAAAWGDMVKSAFDLYRHALLKRLGYDQSPGSLVEERRIWRLVSQQLVYGDTRRVTVPPFQAASTSVLVEPSWLKIDLHRSVEPIGSDGRQRIHLRVEHRDPAQVAAQRVTVVETLPANADIVHASTHSTGAGLRVTGVNPVQLSVGPVPCGATNDITYEIVRYKS